MARTSILSRTILSSLLLGAFIVVAPGCKKGGSSDSAELTPPAAPTYENPFDELNDLPKQMTAQVDWVSQPLRDAAALGEEFTAIQAKYSIDAKTLETNSAPRRMRWPVFFARAHACARYILRPGELRRPSRSAPR